MRRLLTLPILLAALLLIMPAPALAQEGGAAPAFRIDGWSTDPATLRRGDEFDLTVSFTNTGGEAATGVSITIGQSTTFVGLDSGAFIDQVGPGESGSGKLRVAVSNTVTTGHYSIPLQFSYGAPSSPGIPLGEVKTIGVHVEGMAPPGQDVGQPAFDIVEWSVEPQTLRRGQEFTLTVTFANVGTWNGNSVNVGLGQGQNFVELQGAPTIPTIRIGESQTVTLRGAVSNTITTGHYQLPVQFEYHHEAQGGQRLTETENIGVYVEGIAPSTGPDTGRPQIVIADSAVEAGDKEGQINLRLTLHNVGNRWARGVVVNLGPSEVFSPAEGSSAVSVPEDIEVDEQVEVTLPLVLLRSPEGRFTQDFTIEYASYSGGSYQTTERVPISLTGGVAQAPRLLVETYDVSPTPVTPGASFDLTLTVVNVGDGPAEQVFVRLLELGPLAPVGSSNVRFVERIEAGQRIDLTYRLAASGSAEDGLVAFNVELTYDDAFGVETTETVNISLAITAVPHFYIGFFEEVPQPVRVGEVIELPIEVINIGENRVNVSTIEVTSDAFAVRNGSIYLGPLDGGTSGTIVPEAEALRPGVAEIVVTVHYLDNFQQPQTLSETITVEVESNGTGGNGAAREDSSRPARNGSAAAEGDGTLTFGQRLWRGILGFLGLGTRSADASLAGLGQ
ncbi:MAG TPA: hypothetical protein PK607_12595 [Aggregatilineales bacterium]|nr:hypothetical protein [Aggregatilineales bacterium]